MQYQTLADLYAAILKGEIDPKSLKAMADAGEFTIYDAELHRLYRGYEDDAMKFAATILGVRYVYP